jgi:hypothetical protein
MDAVPSNERHVSSTTTGSLSSGGVEQTAIELDTSYRLLALQASAPARIRLYSTLAAQAADIDRPVDVSPGEDSGLMFEYVTDDSDTHLLTVLVDGASLEAEPSTSIPTTVTNLDVGGQEITVTLTWVAVVWEPSASPPATPTQIVPVGPPQSHTFTEGDRADSGSVWGDAGVWVMPWTPTVSGSLLFLCPADNGDSDWADSNFDYYLFRGNVEGVDYPGRSTPWVPSGEPGWHWSDPGVKYLEVWGGNSPGNGDQESWFVDAGAHFTLVVVDWNSGFVGHTAPLDSILVSLYAFGGLDQPPPPPPPGYEYAVVELPGGELALRPTQQERAGRGADSHSEGATDNAATGRYSHAEGSATSATADWAHAEGFGSKADGDASHAGGMGAHAWRHAEHAESSGYLYVAGPPSERRPIQASRLMTGGETVSSGDLSTQEIPLTDNCLSVCRLEIGAWCRDTDLASKWNVSVVVARKAGVSRMVAPATIAQLDHDTGTEGWAISVTDTSAGMAINVASSGSDARWVCLAEIVEVP